MSQTVCLHAGDTGSWIGLLFQLKSMINCEDSLLSAFFFYLLVRWCVSSLSQMSLCSLSVMSLDTEWQCVLCNTLCSAEPPAAESWSGCYVLWFRAYFILIVWSVLFNTAKKKRCSSMLQNPCLFWKIFVSIQDSDVQQFIEVPYCIKHIIMYII